MSASHNGSSDTPQQTLVPQFQQLTPLGTTGGDWLNELKSLGYMPAGQTSWGNLGQTTMVPQVPTPQAQSGDGTQTGIGGVNTGLVQLIKNKFPN